MSIQSIILKRACLSGSSQLPNGFKDMSIATTEYFYDANGNLVKDLNQNLEGIVYNSLNLPTQIDVMNSFTGTVDNFIQYQYRSDGVKLGQKVYTNGAASTTRDYCGRFVYENQELSYIIFSEGTIRVSKINPGDPNNPEFIAPIMTRSGTQQYGLTREFHLKDHLGNVRIVFNTSGILSENHYYPFGLPIHNLSTSTAPAGKENRYLYNGKELQDDLGLNWMDYGARFYDPQIGRFHSIDNSSENYYSYTPYNYVGNNPIKRVDPDGNDWWDKVLGVGAALVDNALGGMTNVRETAAQYVTDPSDFNDGLTVGDVASVAIGAANIAGGQSLSSGGQVAVAGSAVGLVPSGGTSAVPLLGGAAAVATGETMKVHGAMMVVSGSKNLAEGKGKLQENKTGTKSDNKLKPSSEATGDHSSFKTDGSGKITNTATYKQNPKNPSGFDEAKRVDVTGKADNGVKTPHVHEPKQKVRPARPDELPRQQ